MIGLRSREAADQEGINKLKIGADHAARPTELESGRRVQDPELCDVSTHETGIHQQ